MGIRVGSIVVAAALVGSSAGARDWDQIRASGVLRTIVSQDEQPEMFNLGTGGQPGFEREMVEGFARLHKLTVEPVPVPRYDARIPELEADHGDLIIGIIRTPARLEQIDFTVETMPTRRVAVSWKPRPPVADAAALASETIGLLEGTTTWLAAVTDAGVSRDAIRFYPTLEGVIGALRDGTITATVMSASDVGLAKRKHPEIQIGAILGASSSAGWGVKKGNDGLREALDQYVTSLRRTPTWSRLVVQYFGEETLMVLGKQ